MTTPRFPHDFWSKLRTPQDLAKAQDELMLSHDPVPPPAGRFEAIADFFDKYSKQNQPARDAAPEERVDRLNVDGPWQVVADWQPGLGSTRQSLFIPEHYEPKYAYPLLVWLTDDGLPCRLASVMTDVSTRNFFGLAFPVPREPAGDDAAQAEARSAFVLDALKEAVLTVRRRFHIHSERIYLAGFGAGAGWALQLVVQKPEWFGGAAVLGGRAGSMKEALTQLNKLQGKRVLLGLGGPRENGASAEELTQAGAVLHSAGVDVETQTFEGGHESTARLLSQVNRWMMDGIYASV